MRALRFRDNTTTFWDRDRLASGDNYGLVVDGESLGLSLQHAPDLLLDVMLASPAVICCRLSPLQKCQVGKAVWIGGR